MPYETHACVYYRCRACNRRTDCYAQACPFCGGRRGMDRVDPSHVALARVPVEPEGLVSPAAMVARALEFGPRLSTGIEVLDRVLGKHPTQDAWGLHVPSCVQLGGRKGSGKSTLLLQALVHLAATRRVLYVSAEEPENNVYLRACRLGLDLPARWRFLEFERAHQPYAGVYENIAAAVAAYNPAVVGVDSLSMLRLRLLTNERAREQVEIAKHFYREAHASQRTYILLNQQTKDGQNAGLEEVGHAINGSFLLSRVVDPNDDKASEASKALRRLHSDKNRDGKEEATALFTMTERGLHPLRDATVERTDHPPGGAPVRVETAAPPTRARRRSA